MDRLTVVQQRALELAKSQPAEPTAEPDLAEVVAELQGRVDALERRVVPDLPKPANA